MVRFAPPNPFLSGGPWKLEELEIFYCSIVHFQRAYFDKDYYKFKRLGLHMNFSWWKLFVFLEYLSFFQCCGSGSGIRSLFDPSIRDAGWVESQHPDRDPKLAWRIRDPWLAPANTQLRHRPFCSNLSPKSLITRTLPLYRRSPLRTRRCWTPGVTWSWRWSMCRLSRGGRTGGRRARSCFSSRRPRISPSPATPSPIRIHLVRIRI